VLALGLLGAVAFQQNPIKPQGFNVPIHYDNLDRDLILLDPPQRQAVTLVGTQDSLAAVNDGSVFWRVDLTHAGRGQHQFGGRIVVPGNSGLTAVDGTTSFGLSIDDKVTDRAIPIIVRVSPAPGWQITGQKVDPPTVKVTAPASLVGDPSSSDALQAVVNVGDNFEGTTSIPNLSISFVKSGKTVGPPLPRTIPASAFTPTFATASVDAVKPNVTRETTLTETPTGTPAPGYRVSAVTISPLFVKVTGPASAVNNLDTLDLGAIDVSGRSGTFSVRIQIGGVLPQGVTSDTPAATVTITISQNPAVKPSPTPTPTPSP
jgi:YbbR domain-containing protein